MATTMMLRERTDRFHPTPHGEHLQRVLFLCRENDTRSQMAEALLRLLSHGRIEVSSAGFLPTSVHPYAIKALSRIEVDISQQRAKSVDDFRSEYFDRVIALCDPERESGCCDPGDVRRDCWRFPDPVVVEGTAEEKYRAFEQTGLQLTFRIRYLLLFLQREK
jgi:arsenate reductase